MKGLETLSERMTLEVLNEGIDDLLRQEPNELVLTFPKFKIESGIQSIKLLFWILFYDIFSIQ